MRAIRNKTRWGEVACIGFLVYIYFEFAHMLRPVGYEPDVLFFMTVFHVVLTILFFYIFSRITHPEAEITISAFIFTYVYTLIPTTVWFFVTSSLYLIIPPPRTFSFQGTSFSIAYMTFSLCMLCWKVILVYLAVRFASKLAFYRIVYALLLYGAVFTPYMVFLYHMQYFRIPFI